MNDGDMLSSASRVTKHPNLPRTEGVLGLGAVGIKTGIAPGKSGRVAQSVMSPASAVLYGSLS